jgi:hypothetical protein
MELSERAYRAQLHRSMPASLDPLLGIIPPRERSYQLVAVKHQVS